MTFDADLVLIDGTITMTTGTDTPAISTTRDTGTGGAVIDIRKTGANGLVAVLILPADLIGGADSYTLLGFIEVSDTEDMTGTTTGIDEVGKFGIASAVKGQILGIEAPGVAYVRFATKKKYVRANLTVNGDFGAPQVLLSPYPFANL